MLYRHFKGNLYSVVSQEGFRVNNTLAFKFCSVVGFGKETKDQSNVVIMRSGDGFFVMRPGGYELEDLGTHIKPVKVVIYHSLEKPNEYWVRDYKEFNDEVERDGNLHKRFTLLG